MIQTASTYCQDTLNAAYSGTYVDSSFTGKEKDSESGYHYFGARYYDCEALTGWLSVDSESDELPHISAYNYCENNPIILNDPNGEFPLLANMVGAVASTAIEYAGQVASNLVSGQSISQSLTNIDVLDLGVAAAEGFVTSGTNIIKKAATKTAVSIGATLVTNTFDVNMKGESNVSDAKYAVMNTVVDLAGLDKTKSIKVSYPKTKSPNKAVKAARAKGPLPATQSKQIAQKTRVANENKKIVRKTVQNKLQTTPGKGMASTAKGEIKKMTTNRMDNER